MSYIGFIGLKCYLKPLYMYSKSHCRICTILTANVQVLWLPGHCYVVAKVFWLIAQRILTGLCQTSPKIWCTNGAGWVSQQSRILSLRGLSGSRNKSNINSSSDAWLSKCHKPCVYEKEGLSMWGSFVQHRKNVGYTLLSLCPSVCVVM